MIDSCGVVFREWGDSRFQKDQQSLSTKLQGGSTPWQQLKLSAFCCLGIPIDNATLELLVYLIPFRVSGTMY
jgi:hypothetical protein